MSLHEIRKLGEKNFKYFWRPQKWWKKNEKA